MIMLTLTLMWILHVCSSSSVGEPITVPKTENPSPEVVDMYHAMYIRSLVTLFDKHKIRHGLKECDTLLVQWPLNFELWTLTCHLLTCWTLSHLPSSLPSVPSLRTASRVVPCHPSVLMSRAKVRSCLNAKVGSVVRSCLIAKVWRVVRSCLSARVGSVVLRNQTRSRRKCQEKHVSRGHVPSAVRWSAVQCLMISLLNTELESAVKYVLQPEIQIIKYQRWWA